MSLSQYKNRRGRAYQCRRCCKVDRKGRMISHILKDHVPLARAPYHCTFCLFRSTDRQSLQNHITRYSRHSEKEALMGVPDYTDVLVKASEPYWIGDDDMVQLSQEESARWYTRQGKGVYDGYCDDSEGLFEEEEDVIITEGKALPRWLVADDNSNQVVVPKPVTGVVSYRSPTCSRVASMPSFTQSLNQYVATPLTQFQGTSYVPASNVQLGQCMMSNGFPAVTRTTYSSLASLVPSNVSTFPPQKTHQNPEGLVPASMGQALDTLVSQTVNQQQQNPQFPIAPSFRPPTPLNQQNYDVQRVRLPTAPTTKRAIEQDTQPQMAQHQQRQFPQFEQPTSSGNFEYPNIKISETQETITTKLSYPTVGPCSNTESHEMPTLNGIDIDRLLNTPHASSKTPQGTPLQDEIQIQVTDIGDPLYQEAFGSSTQTPAKKPRLELTQAGQEKAVKEKGTSVVEKGLPTKVKEVEMPKEKEMNIPQPEDDREKSNVNDRDQPALHINFEKEKEMTTAEAIIEAAKMICKALDDNTRVARCAEKATLKIAGELERIDRKLTRMERSMTLRSGEEEVTVGEDREVNNKENIELKDNSRKEDSKSTKKAPLKSVVQQIKKKK